MLKNCFNKMNVRRVFVFLIVVCVVNLLVLLYKLNMASAPDASLVRHTRDKDSEIYEDWTEPFLYPRQMRDQVFIVCLVYTAVERRDQRKAIRETWASRRLWDNKRVLVYFALEESNITSNEIFVEEINKNNDIIIFEIDDMGDKKTELTKSAFIWMARQFANFQYFLKTDDDIFVNMDALVNYLGKLNSNKLVIARDTRSWFDFVSQRLYAPDPRVPSYVISSDVVRELTRNFELEKIHGKTKFSRELYEKLNIRLRDNQGFDTGQNLQTICEVKDILTSTHVPFLRVWRYWRLVNDWVEFVTCEDGDTEIVSAKGTQNHNNAQQVHKFVSVPDPHNIPMVLDHPKVCHEKSPVFVVVCVISSPVHFDRRIAIRETWGRYFDPLKMVNIVTVFVLGTSTDTAIQKKILFEDNLFGDIIQGDFDDTYEHLVFKTLSLLRWVMNNCASAKYVVKVDDDVWLNFDLLLKILQPAPRSKFYLGFPRIYAPVLRGPVAKWYTPEEMYPSTTYHPYQSGPAYVLSNDLVGKIFEASKTSKIFKWEDIYLGGIINKLGTYPYSSIDFDMMGLARSTCALRACAMCHKYYAKDFLYHWNLIKLKERKDITCQSNAHPYIPKFGILDTNPDRQIYVNRDHSLGQKLVENTPYRTSHSQLCRYYDDKRDPIFLLVLIFSDGADFDNRRYARVLYAKPRVINGKRVQPFFVVGSRGERDLRNLLENENRMYADLIILDQLDTKQNNTLKLELALQWVLMSCPDYRFIMKVTYKEYVNFENTVSYLSKVSSSRFVVGNVVMPTGESSSSRPILEMYKPPYLQGDAIILSADIVRILAKTFPWKPYIMLPGPLLSEIFHENDINMVHHGGILMKPPSFARNQKFCILHDLLICSKLPTYRYLLSMKLLSGDFYACPNYRSSLSQQPASENAGRFYGRQNLIAFETKLDAVSYMHDFQYIIKNEQKCQLFGQMKVKSVLILIVSTPEHSENRKLIRKTWARDNFVEDKNILFMFLVGDTRNELVKKDLSLENAQYGDIIQDSFEDTPGSDAIKTVSALKWAAKFCSEATFVVMTSDGIYLNVIRLIEYLRSSDTAEKSLLLGSLMKHDSHIERDHNSIVQLSTHTYVMSSDVVHTLYLATMRTQLAGNTDVYFADLMKSLDILPRYHQAFSRRQFVKGLDQYLLNFHVTWEVRVPENMTSLHELRKPIDTFYDYNSDKVNEPGRYSFLIANPKRCRRGKQRKNVKVAIFVFSDCASDKWRQSARETWIRDLKTITDVGTVVNFVLGKCDVNEDDLIKTEFENFGDVIQGSFNDSGYYSNTLKTYLVLRWSSTYCFPSKFVIKLDQNVFLNVDSLINQLKSLGQQYNLFGSKITNEISPRNKDSLDFVPHSTWPYQYLPPYLAPDAYAMSADLVQDLYVGSYYAELVANEALFLGLVAHHIGASITDNDKFRTIERFNICEFSENFAVRTKTNTEFHTVHRFLKNEERCNGMKPMIKE